MKKLMLLLLLLCCSLNSYAAIKHFQAEECDHTPLGSWADLEEKVNQSLQKEIETNHATRIDTITNNFEGNCVYETVWYEVDDSKPTPPLPTATAH